MAVSVGTEHSPGKEGPEHSHPGTKPHAQQSRGDTQGPRHFLDRYDWYVRVDNIQVHKYPRETAEQCDSMPERHVRVDLRQDRSLSAHRRYLILLSMKTCVLEYHFSLVTRAPCALRTEGYILCI